jgi:hypothetical protein
MTVDKDYALLDHEGNAIAVLRQGEADRNFPGYSVSEFLYRHFLKVWRSFHRYTREKERVWKDSGTAFVFDGERLNSKPSADIQRIVVRTEFFTRTDGPLPPLRDQDIEDMEKEQKRGEV